MAGGTPNNTAANSTPVGLPDKSLVTRAQLERTLADADFVRAHRFEVLELGPGFCTVLAPFQSSSMRPGGIVGGPLLMTLADVTMWLAVLTIAGLDEMMVTTELNTSFLNAARGGDVSCSVQILKAGKRLVYGVAECRAEDGKLLTHHTLSYMRLGQKPV